MSEEPFNDGFWVFKKVSASSESDFKKYEMFEQ